MTNRRQFLLGAASLAATARLAHAWAQPFAQQVTVQPPCGPLRGLSEDGINMFRGVPFAQPPLGPLRFRAPRPMQPWSETRDAGNFAAAAMQPGEAGIQKSEDCLYLNVWAPQNAKALPVFVWIHGGGFTGGYSFDPLFDGRTFAHNGVICVTIAYRLGVFGFLDMGTLLDSSYAGSANNGLQDIIMALRWVQQNIAAFGGDPKRVTIGGESAGAKLTDLLMSVPAAEPLFQQVISESGGADRIWPASRSQEAARAFGKQWADANGAAATLRDAAPAKLIAAQEEFIRTYPVHFPLRAEVDGSLFKQMPLPSIRQGSAKRKRLLLGTNRDESALFLGPHPSTDPTAKDLGNMSVDEFRPIEERYKQIYPDMNAEMQRIRSVTAEEYWVPSMRVAEAHVGSGGEAFVYRLDYSEPTGRFAGLAFHSFDIRFVWDHLAKTDDSSQDQVFASTVHAAWIAFIQGKAPQGPGLPQWKPYNLKTRPTMLLDTTSKLVDNPQASELALWQGKLMQ